MPKICWRADLGRRSYHEVWDLQRQLVRRRQSGDIPDVLLLVEHPPTYTLGRGGKREHLLADERELERLGATFVLTDRGGDITFHGHGQLVGYPIMDLKESQPDVHVYLRRLEEVIIRTVARFGIEGRRLEGLNRRLASAGKARRHWRACVAMGGVPWFRSQRHDRPQLLQSHSPVWYRRPRSRFDAKCAGRCGARR